MSWVNVGGAAVGAIGGLLGSEGGGGSSMDTGPWAAAQPFLAKQAIQANALQDQYTAMPFNQQQLAAITNQYGQSDFMRNLVPSLLTQLSAQPMGYDRNNPSARPQAFNFGLLSDMGGLRGVGLLDAQNRQNAIDAQDARESEDLIAGRRDSTRFFPLGLTYGNLTPQGIKGK